MPEALSSGRENQNSSPRAWRSLEELAKTPTFLEKLQREFPRQAAELGNVDRRRFLQLSGASLGLAGLTACAKQPPEKVVPYVRQPEDIVPGKPLFFATALSYGGYGVGVLGESHIGRPTKLEGNPDHPASLGASDIFAQAAVLDLYDPQRSQAIQNLREIRTWEAFKQQIGGLRQAFVGLGGEGLALLTGTVTSPTLGRLIARLLAEMPKAKWYQDEQLHGNTGAAVKAAFGGPAELCYDFAKADVVLAIDSDFLNSGPCAVAFSKAFTKRRQAHTLDSARTMSRLYSVESMPSGLSSVADHRVALRPTQVLHFLVALAAELNVAGASRPAGFDQEVHKAWVEEVAADLKAHAGKSVVIAGEFLEAEAQVLALAINQALGNIGSTVHVTEPVAISSPSSRSTLADLHDDISAGRVKSLFFLGVNPVFSAPADLDFAKVLDKVTTRVHVGLHYDETAEFCHWHVPESHFLESWGDIRSKDGTATIIQPLVNPLYDSHSIQEVVATLLGVNATDDELVKETWSVHPAAAGQASFERFWRKCVHDGLVPGTAAAARSAAVDGGAVASALAALGAAGGGGLELLFRPDPTVLDGRLANNGWLQECPKPITKLVWDNALMMSPRTAKDNGLGEVLREGEQVPWAPVVKLEAGGHSQEIAVWIVPGMADGTLVLHLGYGRRQGVSEPVAAAGWDANRWRGKASAWRTTASFAPTGGEHTLASTQDHHSMEGREPVRVTNLPTYEAHPDQPIASLIHVDPTLTMMPAYDYSRYAWGMSIDLTSCTGCNACLVACVAENNIPVIGKDEVKRGREMHWIRVDRYFVGDDPNNIEEVLNQPLTCMQCEQAPCEVVCPVAATVHSDEGLNDMVYNRCVGTRYCSNNCPYKVRRFNFLLYQDFDTPQLKLGRNPDVSIRSRGVMEKCTYCVQRINQARIESKRERRKIKDGEIVTACQQACPSDAIVFGNINDAEAQVTKAKHSKLNYSVLDELGTRPRTTYLARVMNPNPQLAKRLHPERPLVEERKAHHGPAHGADHGQVAGDAAHAPAGSGH